ncbi:hypothetical protein [Tardiphaga sp.]|jgi:hypothetical protein|uniref:hypothetical protein n=1 Tax=Tardiphaga sp. TaxID=1926292 RepID=UPI0037D9BE30
MWRNAGLAAELDFHTVGWVSMLLVCGRDHPLSRGAVSWDHLRQHRKLMLSKRREGLEKHSLRVAAEVWRVESHRVILQVL